MSIVQRLGLGLRSIFAQLPSRWLLHFLKRILPSRIWVHKKGAPRFSGGSPSSTAHDDRTPPPDTTIISLPVFYPWHNLASISIFWPQASRSTQDIGTLSIQDSYPLRSLSVHGLRTRSPSPITRSSSPIRLADGATELEAGTPQDVNDDRYSQRPTQYTIDPFTDPPSSGHYIPPNRSSTEICVKRIFTGSDILKPETLHAVTKAMHKLPTSCVFGISNSMPVLIWF
ncbi:hypothetical protein B0H12DRAFT_1098829 [Mycena haematopus]|nr:hypothetical protein B0H12DRAFT_1098829 [Mycena haematopus]